ncbi:hypothetical protein, partial [Burkholderia gladioli]|uniref:hypothetical protein n=1 Tax=Burkholderia gladioli TaxID=28095 RepID=UPI001ABB62DF
RLGHARSRKRRGWLHLEFEVAFHESAIPKDSAGANFHRAAQQLQGAKDLLETHSPMPLSYVSASRFVVTLKARMNHLPFKVKTDIFLNGPS